MKKHIALSICILLLFNTDSVKAQNFRSTPGPPFKMEYVGDLSNLRPVIGDNSTGIFYQLKKQTNDGLDYVFTKFDKKTLKEEWTVNLGFPTLSSNEYKLDVGYKVATIVGENKLFVFVKIYSKDEKQVKCLVKGITMDGRIDKDFSEVTSLESDRWGVGGRNFYYVLSPDKTKMLFIKEFEWPKKASETFLMLVDLKDFKQLWTNQKELPNNYNNSTVYNYNFKIDNEGTFSYLFRYRLSSENDDLGTCLAVIDSKSSKPIISELKMDNKIFLSNVEVFQTSDNKFLVTGMFRDESTPKKKEQWRAGIYSYLVNKSGVIETREFLPFSDPINEKMTYAMGATVQLPSGEKTYRLQDVKEMNGAYYLFENHIAGMDMGGGIGVHEREFIVTKISKSGNIQWINVFPKWTRDMSNGYPILVHNNKFYLFYRDNAENLEKFNLYNYDPKKIVDSPLSDSKFVYLEISPDGSAKRAEIPEEDGWTYDPEPQTIYFNDEHTLLLKKYYTKRKGAEKELKGSERYDTFKIE